MWLIMSASFEELYIHLPFCVKKCAYCDFTSWGARADSPFIKAYCEVLNTQIDLLLQQGLLRNIATVYFGGGTPTLAGSYLVQLVRKVREAAPYAHEISVEANPECASQELLIALQEAGMTRISFGVQSTNDAELARLGRVHTADEARAALRRAVQLGVSVSADLMCALEGQTQTSWRKTLQEVCDCGIAHVSVYPLSIEPHTALYHRFGADEPLFNSPDLQAEYMLIAHDFFESQGFSQYEVASYAKPSHACLHNLGYWSGTSYLGLGVGAASMFGNSSYSPLVHEEVFHLLQREYGLDAPSSQENQNTPAAAMPARIRWQNPRGMQDFLHAGTHFLAAADCEYLSSREACAEDLMLAARKQAPLSTDLRERACGLWGNTVVNAVLNKAQAQGLLDSRLKPTQKGWLLGNKLYGLLWSLADMPTPR